MARLTALTDNGGSLFVRLVTPHQHTEAITSRPLLLQAPARVTRHAGQTRLTISHPPAQAPWVEQVCREIAAFFKTLRQTAEQLTPHPCWCQILSRVLVKYRWRRELVLAGDQVLQPGDEGLAFGQQVHQEGRRGGLEPPGAEAAFLK